MRGVLFYEPCEKLLAHFFPRPAFAAVCLSESLFDGRLRVGVEVLEVLASNLMERLEGNLHELVRRAEPGFFHPLLNQLLRLGAQGNRHDVVSNYSSIARTARAHQPAGEARW